MAQSSQVLVVEDDVLSHMLTVDMFVDAGYEVFQAGTADEALVFLEAEAAISLLFTDVTMSGSMNGAELARRVAVRWPLVAIIVASGRKRPSELPQATCFHAKPYEQAVVLRQAHEMRVSRG